MSVDRESSLSVKIVLIERLHNYTSLHIINVKQVSKLFEVEIKVIVSNPYEMQNKFVEKGGTYKTSLIHEDTYFNMPKGLRDFKQTDEALRIRKSIAYSKRNKEEDRVQKYFVAYKGKKLDTSTKTRKEIEFEIEDGVKMKELFKALGFQEVFTVEKERELYEFTFKNRHIEALIDYLPILKTHFIEVEYMAESAQELEQARAKLFEFLSQFGIKKEESITKSYLELIAEKFKKNRDTN